MSGRPLVRLDRGTCNTGYGPGTATITLDSPANRNALSAQLRRELMNGLDIALADDEVRVIVLTHTGPRSPAGPARRTRGSTSSRRS